MAPPADDDQAAADLLSDLAYTAAAETVAMERQEAAVVDVEQEE